MKYMLTVRYGAMRLVGRFASEIDGLRIGDKVVARTDRGTEMGEVVSGTDIVDDSEAGAVTGEVLRKLTPDDEQRLIEIEEQVEPAEFKFCEEHMNSLKLPMQLVRVEHLLGDDKIVFYFMAEGRVDFRQLVKDLAQEYRTRIEMRQIGVRDEARLLADFEHCGRELCCKTFMKKLEPVTMKMAKNQKATLDPSKISGRCGRLMCCLRFEDKTYEALKRSLPRKGTRVLTPEGEGDVIAQDILSQLVRVELADRREAIVPLEDIKIIAGPERETNGDDGDNG